MRCYKIAYYDKLSIGVSRKDIYHRNTYFFFYEIHRDWPYGNGKLMNILGEWKNCYLSFGISSNVKAFNVLGSVVL